MMRRRADDDGRTRGPPHMNAGDDALLHTANSDINNNNNPNTTFQQKRQKKKQKHSFMTYVALFVLTVSALLSYNVYEILHHAGHWRTITPHHNTDCVKLGHSVHGAEDMTLYDGHLFVATDKRALWAPSSLISDSLGRQRRLELLGDSANGFIYVFDDVTYWHKQHTIPGLKEPKNKDGKVHKIEQPDFRPLHTVGMPDIYKRSFHPHGLYVLPKREHEIEGDQQPHIAVISHGAHGDVIHIFQLMHNTMYDHPEKLRYVATLSHPLFVDLNDVAMPDLSNFYVSNTHTEPAGTWAHAFEVLTRRSWGYLLHCKGDPARMYADLECHKVLQNLAMPNGVNISPYHVDGASTLYVAETARHRLLVFHRDARTSHLSLKTTIALDTHIDNVEINRRTGHITAAAHPKLFELMKHKHDPLNKHPSPSQVLHIHPNDIDTAHGGTHHEHDLSTEEFDIMEVFVDDGKLFSGSSAAVVTPPQEDGSYHLFVGGLYTQGLLMCNMNVKTDTVPLLFEKLNLPGGRTTHGDESKSR